MEPSFATHNICGLALDNKNNFFNPKSNHSKYVSLRTLLRNIDFISLTETKIAKNAFNFNNFCPFGKALSPLSYSATGQTNGIFTLYNPVTFESTMSSILFEGRLILNKLIFLPTKTEYAFFSIYLPSNDPNVSLQVLKNLEIEMSAQKAANENIKIILFGDFNLPRLRQSCNNLMRISPNNQVIKLTQKFGLTDVALSHDLLQPTWRGRGLNSHRFSTLDYVYITNNVVVKDISYFSVATSDHEVLFCSGVKNIKKIGKLPSERLFNCKTFSELAKTELDMCHENYTRSYPSIIHENDPEYFIRWLDIMSNALEFQNKQFCATNFMSSMQKEKNFRNKLSKAIKKLSQFDTVENRREIEAIRNDHTNSIDKDQEVFRKRLRVKAAISFGRNNAFSFSNYKSRSDRKISSIYSVNNPEKLIHDPEQIVKEFADFHSKKTAVPNFSKQMLELGIQSENKSDPIDFIFNKFNLSLADFFPTLYNQMPNIKISQQNIKDVFLTMKACSSPGPSGRGKFFYSFLFNHNPFFFTQAINQLLQIQNLSDSNYAWIKKRKIIFILKKGKDKLHCSSYRPISLLESLYKIMSKLLMNLISPSLDQIVSENQFGFMRNRSLNQASTNTLFMVKELSIPQKFPNAILLFLDICSAFDSISPNLVNKIFCHIFPNSQLAKLVHNLTTNGSFFCEIAGAISACFELVIGAGQGDPLSGLRYILVHHLFISFIHVLQTNLIPNSVPKMNDGFVIKASCFADDTSLPICLKSHNDMDIFLYILNLAKFLTNLQINPLKTQVLMINEDANNLPPDRLEIIQKIGQPKNSVLSLGLIVGKDWQSSADSSWKKSMDLTFKACDKFHFYTRAENPLHKKQLVTAILQPTYNFIARVHPLSLSNINLIDKKIRAAIWSKRMKNVSYGRPKIAQARLTDSITTGGLGFKPVLDQIFTSLLSGAFNVMKFCFDFPHSFLAKQLKIDFPKLCMSGSRNLTYLNSIFLKIFPFVRQAEGFNFFSRFETLITALEKDKIYFWQASLANNVLTQPFNLRVSNLPCTDTLCVGSYINTCSPLRPLPLKWSSDTQQNLTKSAAFQILMSKLKKLSPFCPTRLIKSPTQKIVNFFYAAIHFDNAFFTKALKHIKNSKATKTPPSFQTRINDKIPMQITQQQFKSVYIALANYTLPAEVHWTALEILNRTMLTPKLLYLNKKRLDPLCNRCHVPADNFHLTNECAAPFLAFRALQEFSKLKNIEFVIQNFSLFLPIQNVPSIINEQYTHLIVNMLQLSYTLQFETRFIYWTPLVFFAKIQTVINSTITVRKFARWNCEVLEEFRDFYNRQLDTFRTFLFPQDTSHCREILNYDN